MEKRPDISPDKVTKIIITGPESTGKTLITSYLADYFNAEYVPEYAREYIEKLQGHYQYDDVIHIARKQIELEKEFLERAGRVLFYDTFLIITKVWLQVVYQDVPLWLDDYIHQGDWDLFLLCKYDIPWEDDPVRENPGEMRIKLFDMYHHEIKQLGIPCKVITGMGEERYNNALSAVQETLDGVSANLK
ncbi:MAG: ATP-binding protein [Bacteroidales bacterium]|nr:ATP-binding protein [Bacteroidales bacterium]